MSQVVSGRSYRLGGHTIGSTRHSRGLKYSLWSRSSYPSSFQHVNTFKTHFGGASSVSSAFSSPYRKRLAGSETTCPSEEDFTVDEMVKTRQCSTRRQCRARLTIVKEGPEVLIKAGYYIYTKAGQVLTVAEETKSKLKATTAQQAQKWAKQLLSSASARLDEIDCAITIEVIADAILKAIDTAATCPETGDPLCNVLLTIGSCTVAEPTLTGGTDEEKACLEFVESSTGVSSFAELQRGCTNAVFMYNRVGVSLPVCQTTCDSNPCTKQAVYMDFFVQTNKMGDQPANCTAAVLIPAYKMVYVNIPECDSAPLAFDDDEGYTIVPIADVDKNNVPKELADLAETYGCEFTYAFFVKVGATFDEAVEASCAAL